MKVVLKQWNKLSRDVVDAPFLEIFKVKLHEALATLF